MMHTLLKVCLASDSICFCVVGREMIITSLKKSFKDWGLGEPGTQLGHGAGGSIGWMPAKSARVL